MPTKRRQRAPAPGDEQVVAVSEGGIPEEMVLGRLATYTNPDDERSSAKFVRSWAAHGLNPDELPEARQPVHVFQSACASVRRRKAPGSNGHRIEIRADEVVNTPSHCSYQITVVTWDRASETIEHEKAMRVNFDKRSSAITVDELDAFDDRLRSIEDAINADFLANAKTIPGQKVRNAVRAQILRIGGQNLRRKAGGLYFVPLTWRNPDTDRDEPTKPILDGLKGVLHDLFDERADFYTVPVASDEGTREMVRKHFTINAAEQAKALTAKAVERIRKGKGAKGQRNVRKEMIDNLGMERRKLYQAVKQFDELVQLEQDDLRLSLAELDEAIGKLQEFQES